MKHFTEVELDAIMSHKLTQYVHDEDIRALAAYAKELRQALKELADELSAGAHRLYHQKAILATDRDWLLGKAQKARHLLAEGEAK